jgi:hypothetical protein
MALVHYRAFPEKLDELPLFSEFLKMGRVPEEKLK